MKYLKYLHNLKNFKNCNIAETDTIFIEIAENIYTFTNEDNKTQIP